MPILGPGGVTQFTIADLVNEVIIKCENRVTDINRAYVWLRDALLEITSDPSFRNEFDDLEILGTAYSLTPNIQTYSYANIVPAGDYNLSTLDVMLWTDPPTNQNRIQLNPSHYQEADKLSPSYPSQPTDWYRFGDTIGFVPTPMLGYQVQARLYRMHPINDNALSATVLLIPRDWHNVLVLAAVEQGFTELEEYEKAGAIHNLLHGDPKYPQRLGMIEGKKKRREREAWRQQQPLRPVVRGYGFGSRGR